jgi:hypothetical protein
MHRFLRSGLPCYFFAVGHLRAAENEPKVITLSCDRSLRPTVLINQRTHSRCSFWVTSFPSLMSMRPASTTAEGRASITVSASASRARLIGQVAAWT